MFHQTQMPFIFVIFLHTEKQTEFHNYRQTIKFTQQLKPSHYNFDKCIQKKKKKI